MANTRKKDPRESDFSKKYKKTAKAEKHAKQHVEDDDNEEDINAYLSRENLYSAKASLKEVKG